VKSFLYFTGLLHWAASLCRFQNFSFWPQNLAGSFLVQQFAQKIVGDKLRQCFINRRPIVGKETDQHPLTGHGFFFKHDADFAHAQPEKRSQPAFNLNSAVGFEKPRMDTDENGFQLVHPPGEAVPIFERLYYPCASVHPWLNCGFQVSADEAGCHAGASPAGRIGLFTTESCIREEAARPSPKARCRLNCPVATTVNLI